MLIHHRFITTGLLCLCFSCTTLFAQQVINTDQGVIVNSTDGLTCNRISFYTPSIVRITKFPQTSIEEPADKSLSVILKPEKTAFSSREKGNEMIVSSENITVIIDKNHGCIRFCDKKGRNLLKEHQAGFDMRQEGADKGAYIISQNWTLDKDEPIYGLGILQDGKMNRRNTHRHMVQNNTEDFVTFFQSIKGYGIFWDNYSPTDFHDSPEGLSFKSEVGDCIDYYFMIGGNADGVIAQMRHLTGEVPMFPLWTFGFWQSRERYKSQTELLNVVESYRKLQIPLDGIVQDWQYWGNNYLWNAMEFMNADFNRAQQTIDRIHELNAHVMISIWSSFGPQTKAYRELNEKNLLFNIKTWPESGISEQWPPRMDYPSGVRVYDAYSAEARDIYWNNLRRLYDHHIDGWWMDSTEPDHFNATNEDYETATALGSFRKVRNAYPLVTVGGVYDHQRSLSSDKRVFILTRSGFAGQQRYGANVWSGDVASSWETLRNQLPAGLNFTMTGNPNFNTDIGGFFAGSYNKAGGVNNPAYRELYVRWMQYGVFSPLMRSHGTDVPREIYQFGKSGEPVYEALKSAVEMRYYLLPYIYSTAWEVTQHQSSYMRALVMDFAHDKQVWDMNNEFMFGKSLLVAPIVNAQYTPENANKVDERSGWDKTADRENINGKSGVDFTAKKSSQIYLPKGSDWYDLQHGNKFKGGQSISCETTLDYIPVFAKAGSILPIGPKVQYAAEKAWDHLSLCIFPGANASFTLYEDEFDNYHYEQGAYSEIPISWDDKTRTLTIGARLGEYPGMLTERTFHILLPGDHLFEQTKTQDIFYDGHEIKTIINIK